MERQSIYLSMLFMIMTVNSLAQLVNINPDPNGNPWIVGDAICTPPEIGSTIPCMVLTPESSALELPSVVDNSQLYYMPPVFDQGLGASCVQVAELWYTFGYEINRFRNVEAGNGVDTFTNLYHPFYSYNFLNGGDGSSLTYYRSGFELIMDNGCPSYFEYDDPSLNNENTKYLYWMDDYDNYYIGMHNKVSLIENICWNDDYESLETLKHWLADHNAGEVDGGLAIISVYANQWTSANFLPGTPEELKTYITQWGTTGGHALTIVGYHDDVQCFDIDEDGIWMNEDFDGDGIIQLDECENGAFKVVNSHGTDWGNEGYVYIPYKLMAAGLQDEKKAYTCYVQNEYEPLLSVKTTVDYPCRKRLKYYVGYAEDASCVTPAFYTNYNSFKFQGGCFDMRGAYSGPINIGLDFSHFYINENFGKIFFILDENDFSNIYDGIILNYSITDYRWDEVFELTCSEENITIINNDETALSIDYDLLVSGDNQEISQNLNLTSNMVSRFSPTVTNDATLTIDDNVSIDMYNSELTIEEGCSLVIGDNVEFHAIRGISKINVYGDVQIGSNVTFTADEESTLELCFGSAIIADCHFQNCVINSHGPLSISVSDFSNSFINQTINDIDVSHSKFNHSSIMASNPTYGSLPVENIASITDCFFQTAYNEAHAIIELYGYKEFEIVSDTLDNISNLSNICHGISLHHSGSLEPSAKHLITDNLIYCSFGCTNDLTGITVYSSIADIHNNYIYSNQIGIQSLGYSRLYITGDSGANSEDQTQRIINNGLLQLYASRNSFPLEFHWNSVYGDVSDCFIYHDVDMLSQPPNVNVTNNYWGPVFDPDINLCPLRHYDFDPVWDLKGGQLNISAAQQLFITGINQIADSNFTQAKSTFQQVVVQYPDEEPAKNALKEILYLEPLAGNNFEVLKTWYRTDSVIVNNEILIKIGENLANKCDEKLEHYPEAIAWYESVIENPESLEDSIFAIIDLEHLYWQMGIDTNLRSASCIGRLSQFKPESFKAFREHKDELLSLLHKSYSRQSNHYEDQQVEASMTDKSLLWNAPNPFKDKTQIHYYLIMESDIQLKIYNNIGQLIYSVSEMNKQRGALKYEFDATDLESGIYFYQVIVNGIPSIAQKMIVL